MTTATIQIHVEPDHLALNLGERASIEVEVFNASSIVDEFKVDLLGPWVDPIRPEWITVHPTTIALFPNSSGTVLLTLDVPAASQLLAGRHLLGVRVRSTTDPAVSYVAELPVTVNSQPVVAVHLDPQTAAGGSSSISDIVARNLGNVPVTLWFSTSDPTGAMQFGPELTEVTIPTDEEVRIPMLLRARRPFLGSATARPYTVQADVEDRAGDVGAEGQAYVEPVRAEGVFLQSARVNGRILTILAVLLPVMAILAAAFILRPQSEPVILSGPLAFGVPGVVDRVEVRPNEVVLAGERIATMQGTEAHVALEGASLALRRAIVDLEGIKTGNLVAQVEAALEGEEEGPAADPAFLDALVQELQAAVESALSVSSTALTGLTTALNSYCGSVEKRPIECDTQPVPLPSAFIGAVMQEAATNPAARELIDANTNYRSASTTLQTVQRLLQDAEGQLVAAGGVVPDATGGSGKPDVTDPDGSEEPEVAPEVTAILAAASEQAQTEYELSLLEQQAVIAEAQLACRAALQDVGRTVLRAPVDLIIIEVRATAGAELEADAAVVIVERTDGRVFTPPAGARAPHVEDLPRASCPGTYEELVAADAA